MKHLTSHSKTSLFLTEMIISLLVLSLAACVCVQLFAGAKVTRERAREWNHIQELTVTVGEFLEGSDGTAEEFVDIFPEGIMDGENLLYYYDSNWNFSSEEEHTYCMKVTFRQETRKKAVLLSFFKKETLLSEQETCFPVFSTREEANAS